MVSVNIDKWKKENCVERVWRHEAWWRLSYISENYGVERVRQHHVDYNLLSWNIAK